MSSEQLAPRAGFEPATNGLEGRRSIQLSYRGFSRPSLARSLQEASKNSRDRRIDQFLQHIQIHVIELLDVQAALSGLVLSKLPQ